MDENLAKELLEKTRQDYNLIAQDYSDSRHRLWPELSIFKDLVKDKDRVLDLGCGHGRLTQLFADRKIDYLGVDYSQEQINLAKRLCPGYQFMVSNALSLELKEPYDIVFSIAVLHHIPGVEQRRRFLAVAKRFLKPGGILIVTVWQASRPKTSVLLFKHTVLKILGLSRMDFRDALIPWADKTERYYHYFTKRELKKLFQQAGFEIQKIDSLVGVGGKHWRRANYYVIARKPVLS